MRAQRAIAQNVPPFSSSGASRHLPLKGKALGCAYRHEKRYSHPISMGREHRCFVVPPRFRGAFPPLYAACFGAASGDFGVVRLIRALGGCPSRPLPQGAFSNCSPL